MAADDQNAKFPKDHHAVNWEAHPVYVEHIGTLELDCDSLHDHPRPS